jgi:hypothetical protein
MSRRSKALNGVKETAKADLLDVPEVTEWLASTGDGPLDEPRQRRVADHGASVRFEPGSPPRPAGGKGVIGVTRSSRRDPSTRAGPVPAGQSGRDEVSSEDWQSRRRSCSIRSPKEAGVTEAIDFGIPGLNLAPGDHVCALYMGAAERDAILFPYLQAGLRSGDKCICIVDQDDTEAVRTGISAGTDNIDACIESGQLQMHTSSETYLACGAGRFTTDDMINFWEDSVGRAMSGDFRFARMAGEMSWALRDLPGLDELTRYESEFNRYVVRYPQWALCLYDLERFGGGILVDVLKTHPKILLGGMVLHNPHYLSPDEFLAQRS